MSTRLIQIVAFANVAASATVALPHDININGTAKTPDYVASDASGFSIVVTDSDVTVTNNGNATASVNVWLELKHSVPRELGNGVQNLTPQPFIAASGSSGGGGPVPPPDPGVVAYYNEDFISLDAVTVVTTGGGAATLRENDISTFVGDVMLSSNANGDAVAVNTSDSKLFMSLPDGAQTTFIGRLQPPFGPPTALADFDIVFGMAQPLAPTASIPNNGTYFRAGFASTGNANWWAVDTRWGLLVDTGVAVNSGGAPQTFQIVYTPGVDEKFYINGALVASGVIGNGGLAVGLTALWQDISRGGDAYHVDYLYFRKELAR